MVAIISHDIIPFSVDDNTIRAIEFPITLPFRPKNTKKGSFFIKDLNAVVVRISHDDLIISLVDSHTSWVIKLALSLSLRPELEQELAISVKDLKAVKR